MVAPHVKRRRQRMAKARQTEEDFQAVTSAESFREKAHEEVATKIAKDKSAELAAAEVATKKAPPAAAVKESIAKPKRTVKKKAPMKKAASRVGSPKAK